MITSPYSRSARLGRMSQRYRSTVGRVDSAADHSPSGASKAMSTSRAGSGTTSRRNASRVSSSRCSIGGVPLNGWLGDEVPIPVEFLFRTQAAELLELPFPAQHRVPHGDRAVLGGRQERGPQRGVADHATGDLELAGEEVEVHVPGDRGGGRERLPPDQPAFGLL